ncbi:DinB family protein [Paenibacillus sp. CAA11]|uniref:DinB family protein n=1 Tax=Paenibacillus sp. CAA11 TaxID=1532905 RepID=UPI002D7877E1|nr:DinB family protein [Paenibacillus sp. CAA11]
MEQRKAWNAGHKLLTSIILKPEEHARAQELALSQHAALYSSQVRSTGKSTLEDVLLQDLKEDTWRKYPVVTPDTKNSIVWHLWHIARIEDITLNLLVAGTPQTLDIGGWNERMNIRFRHSGNEMTEEEISELTAGMDLEALMAYRVAVGLRTRQIIQNLQPGDFKRKVEPSRLSRLQKEGALKPEAQWLQDYWGGKITAGLLLMPATRHNFVHLNKSLRIKNKLQK